jgi:hypothetical protein
MKNIITTTLILLSSFELYCQSSMLIPYRIGDKWGYSDVNGNIKIPTIYDETFFFKNEQQPSGIVKKGELLGVIDTNGKVIIPFYSREIEVTENISSVSYIITIKGKKGVVNDKNQIIIPFKFDEITTIGGFISNGIENFYLAKIGTQEYYFTESGKACSSTPNTDFNMASKRLGYHDEEHGYVRIEYEISREVSQKKTTIELNNKNIFDSIETETNYARYLNIIEKNNKFGMIDPLELVSKPTIESYIPPIYNQLLYSQTAKGNPFVIVGKNDSSFFYLFNQKIQTHRIKYNGNLPKELLSDTLNYIFEPHLIFKTLGIAFYSNSEYIPINLPSYFTLFNKNKYGLLTLKEDNDNYYFKTIEIKYDNPLTPINEYNKYFVVFLNGNKGYINREGFEYFREN